MVLAGTIQAPRLAILRLHVLARTTQWPVGYHPLAAFLDEMVLNSVIDMPIIS